MKIFVTTLIPLFLMLLLGGCKGNTTVPRLRLPLQLAGQDDLPGGEHTLMSTVKLPDNRLRAPEFPTDFAWVNTDKPLSLRESLKGCVVVLDFWTYCCINCMHVLPDLEFLEHKYAGKPVVIIGVHSAKFDNEGDKANIQTACARYNIAHPVIVDEQHRIWSDYAVRSWPTLMIIDPEGKVVGSVAGEGNRDVLDDVVGALLEEGRKKGTLAATPPVIERAGRVPSASGLAFPGKVLAEPSGKYLLISDSNHNRVIIADPQGHVQAIAGSGQRGNTDGSFAAAQFHNPQGMAYDAAGQILYVADTDNHLIRKLDLQAKTVETICGTGEQVYDRAGGGIGTAQGLNSPWDLALDGHDLYIAMAGPHQLWKMNLITKQAAAWVGSGMEDIQDGSGKNAALAQPSGLAKDGDWLYFADSEVSAVRKVNLRTQKVETLVGSGLFDFGDRTGKLGATLLQHPLGVAMDNGDVLVADTYNHKIKRLREQDDLSTVLAGKGKPLPLPPATGELNLYEPGGISVRGDLLYIADTNHDRIIEYQLRTGAWRELTLTGLRTTAVKNMDMAQLPVQEIAFTAGQDLHLTLAAEFPAGVHLNKDAPLQYAVASDQDSTAREGIAPAGQLPVDVTIPAAEIQAGKELRLMLNLAYCTEGNQSLCVPATLSWRVKLTGGAGDNHVKLKSTVKPML